MDILMKDEDKILMELLTRDDLLKREAAEAHIPLD